MFAWMEVLEYTKESIFYEKSCSEWDLNPRHSVPRLNTRAAQY